MKIEYIFVYKLWVLGHKPNRRVMGGLIWEEEERNMENGNGNKWERNMGKEPGAWNTIERNMGNGNTREKYEKRKHEREREREKYGKWKHVREKYGKGAKSIKKERLRWKSKMHGKGATSNDKRDWGESQSCCVV